MALGAEVGDLQAGHWHEDPNPRGFWPYLSLMSEATDNLAPSTSRAVEVISGNPYF